MDQHKKLFAITATSLLVLFSYLSPVFGCSPFPGQRMTSRTFTVNNFKLPARLAYSAAPGVRAQVPSMSDSEQAARALVQNLVSDSVRDVLEESGRRAGLLDFVTAAILNQIQVQISYQPLRCAAVLVDPMPNTQLVAVANMRESCFVIGDTVSAVCPLMANNMMMPQNCQLVGGAMPAIAVPNQHLTINGTITIRNIILSTWTTQQWQSVLNRVLRLLTSRLGTGFFTATVTVT